MEFEITYHRHADGVIITNDDIREDYNEIVEVLESITDTDLITEFENTMEVISGIRTIRKSKRIVLMAWGNNKSTVVQKAIEGEIDSNIPSSFLQKHNNVTFVLDESASEDLTRIKSPWRTGSCDWDEELKAKAVAWLCKQTGKSILNLTFKDAF